MIEILKRYKKHICVFLIVGIVIIPSFIYIMFKIPAVCKFFESVWNAGDVLGFYGVLLGAFSGVVGVFFTIQYSQESYKQDLINRSLPFINIVPMIYDPGIPNGETDCGGHGDIVRPLETYYYIISNKSVSVVSKLTEQQEKMVRCKGIYQREPTKGVTFRQNVKLLYLPLEVENIGNGAATTFSIGLYIPPYSPKTHPKSFSLARSLRAGEKIKIAIYSENDTQDNTGKYDLCVSYYDILGNQYEQSFIYKIYVDENKDIRASLQMNGTQKRL